VVGRWLLANNIELEQLSYRHDITVCRCGDGRREIVFRRTEHRTRKEQRWTVAIPMLVASKVRPPLIRRRLFVNFDKFQVVLGQGHEGRSPQLGNGPEPPACPVCSRRKGAFVPWPCPPLARWMPGWLREQWRERIQRTLRGRVEVYGKVIRGERIGNGAAEKGGHDTLAARLVNPDHPPTAARH
jgi:hypothetical protein